MTVHRYIYPMKILSVEAKDSACLVRVDLGNGVTVVFELPGQAKPSGLKLVLEATEDAKS